MVEDHAGLGLAGRLVIVVGAAQGIGAAVAKRLSALGMQVICADRQDCADIAAQCGSGASSWQVDLTRPETIEGLIGHANSRGKLYGLVNCAGLLVRTPFEEVDEAMMQREIAVNQTGVFYLARAALTEIHAGGAGGRIVLFTSQGAFTGGFFGSTTYAHDQGGGRRADQVAGPHGRT